MSNEDFFNEPETQSQIKTAIVSKYFEFWANIMIKKGKKDKIAYIDLFAGPGKYNDGTKSTPIIILEKIIKNDNFRNRIASIFNDINPEFVNSLEKEIYSLDGINNLKYKPEINNIEVDEELVNIFNKIKMIPTLLFADPWGYKGLSLDLIKSVIKDWGCDCIFFFNYNRINMGIDNKNIEKHIISIFGKERMLKLQTELESLKSTDKREGLIIDELTESLKAIDGKFVLPFRFKKNRTSHFIILVTKHELGYKIMKEIMAKEGSKSKDGVPSYEYNPEKQLNLFDFIEQNIEELSEILLKDFAGQTYSVKEIFEKHSIGTYYINRNYKDALIKLESEEKIEVDPPFSKRRKIKGEITLSDSVIISFPNLKKEK